MAVRVRYHHKPAEQSIEVSFLLISRTGKGKSRRRSQRRLDALPAMSIDNIGEEFAEIVHREYHEANRRILHAVAKSLGAPKAPPAVVYEAVTPESEPPPREHFVTGMSPAVAYEPPTPPPDVPVFEVRPSRAVSEQAPRERSEEAEIAEGLAIVRGLGR